MKEIKIEIFNFEKDWNLVKPHLDDAKLLKLLNKATLLITRLISLFSCPALTFCEM